MSASAHWFNEHDSADHKRLTLGDGKVAGELQAGAWIDSDGQGEHEPSRHRSRRTQSGVIRVPLPALNEERRKDLVKVVHKLAEEARIGIRHARTEGRDKLKKLNHTSEDDLKHAEKELQKRHDDFIAKIDELLKAKEAEIMEV